MHMAWKDIKENIKTSSQDSPGLQEMQYHKPQFDEECLLVLDRRRQDKMQGLQDQKNVNNLNKVRLEASRHFRNKKNEYLKAKIYELETNRKIENIDEFKNGHQLRTNIVKDEKSENGLQTDTVYRSRGGNISLSY